MTLRDQIVEAMAIEICRIVFGAEWDGVVPLVQRRQATRYLDAALDTLEANEESPLPSSATYLRDLIQALRPEVEEE